MDAAIERCRGYGDVKESIQKALEPLGGMGRFASAGETIFVNPNLLQGSEPDEAIVTHPKFILAVVEMLEDAGVDVIIGDSPGGRMTEKGLKKAYKKADWDLVEKKTSATLNLDTEKDVTRQPEGRIIKSIGTVKIMDEVDGIINLPKLKTHSLTVFTGAVKNTYGMVHGLTKSAYHGSFRGITDFSKMLLDVHDAVEPRLTIMDGIVGMEGSGPASGEPVKLNRVIVSRDAIAADLAACRSVGIPIERVKTISLSDVREEDVHYPNLEPDDFDDKIEYPEGGGTPWWAPEFLAGFMSNFYLDRPKVLKKRCIRCGKCKEICSQDAIKLKEDGPKISWWDCIRCYCCTEVCPKEALQVES